MDGLPQIRPDKDFANAKTDKITRTPEKVSNLTHLRELGLAPTAARHDQQSVAVAVRADAIGAVDSGVSAPAFCRSADNGAN